MAANLPNNAALFDARRRHGGASRETLETLVQGSNCKRESKRALEQVLTLHSLKSTAMKSIDYGNVS